MERPQSNSNNNDESKKSCTRGHWRPSEDERLRQLVNQYGPQNWNFISENLQGRSGNSFLFITIQFFISLIEALIIYYVLYG